MSGGNFSKNIKALAQEHANYPQEQLMKVAESKGGAEIGIPVEKELQESRVVLTPKSVKLLVSNGHKVVLETGAGNGANFSDREYSDAGASIVYTSKDVFECSIIVKVEPPSLEEIELMNPGSTLFSAIQLASLQPDYIKQLSKKRITAIAFEFIEDKGGQKPVVRSMSEIAGNSIVSIAGEYLSNSQGGRGVILGGVTGVPPTKVVILGAGTIAETVARTTKAMGAMVRVFDNHHYKLRRLKHQLGEQIFTSIIEPEILLKEISDADVVVGAIRGEEGSTVCVVTEDMVQQMKPDSIIIDASISQGGCFETSRMTSLNSPVFRKYDVIHYCVPNIPSRVARSATKALSNIFTPILLTIGDVGGIDNMIYEKQWFRRGVYLYNGCLTKPGIGRRFNIPHKDLDLLLASNF